jgi:hypothetical protein
MGLLLTPGYCEIPQNRKTAILQIPFPKTKRDILSFLGVTGCFKVWIPNYSITAKPLYEAARGNPYEPYLDPFKSPQTSFTKGTCTLHPNP